MLVKKEKLFPHVQEENLGNFFFFLWKTVQEWKVSMPSSQLRHNLLHMKLKKILREHKPKDFNLL